MAYRRRAPSPLCGREQRTAEHHRAAMINETSARRASRTTTTHARARYTFCACAARLSRYNGATLDLFSLKRRRGGCMLSATTVQVEKTPQQRESTRDSSTRRTRRNETTYVQRSQQQAERSCTGNVHVFMLVCCIDSAFCRPTHKHQATLLTPTAQAASVSPHD